MSLSHSIIKNAIDEACRLVESGEIGEALDETGANAHMLAGLISGLVAADAVMENPLRYNNAWTIIRASLSFSTSTINDIKRGYAPDAQD